MASIADTLWGIGQVLLVETFWATAGAVTSAGFFVLGTVLAAIITGFKELWIQVFYGIFVLGFGALISATAAAVCQSAGLERETRWYACAFVTGVVGLLSLLLALYPAYLLRNSGKPSKPSAPKKTAAGKAPVTNKNAGMSPSERARLRALKKD